MNESARELGIKDYRSVLRRRWRWVLDTLLVVLLVVGILTLTQQRTYEATAEVAILTEANEALFPATATTAERLRRQPFAEQEYLSSESFRRAVGADAAETPAVTYELAPSNPDQDVADAGILVFTARADTAAGAAALANDHAAAYISTRHEQDVTHTSAQLDALESSLMRLREQSTASEAELASLAAQLENATSDADRRRLEADIALLEEERRVLDLAGQIRDTTAEITVLRQVATELEADGVAARVHNSATAPSAPISPDVRRNLILAGLAGLVLGIAGAIARDLLDDTADDPVELAEATGVPVLGAIGELPTDHFDPGDLAQGGGYRTVLNSLSLGSRNHQLRTIAVTSAKPSTGRTKTVVNLARVEAAAGSRVLVVDGDAIAPAVLSRLSPAERRHIDLDDALDPQTDADVDAAGSDVPRIDVIDLSSTGAASSLHGRTAELERLLEKCESRYDLILIDAHAVLSSVDVRPLATKADAVIVVYVPKQSQVDDLRQTIDLLRGANADVAGLVANRSRTATTGYQYRRPSGDGIDERSPRKV